MCRLRFRRRRPAGFTLVELLIVIVVIGILIGLLLPAIMGGVRTAKDAQVSGEINTLAQALQSFKNKYGDFPPSRIILMETGAYDTTNSTLLGAVTWLGGEQTGKTGGGASLWNGQPASLPPLQRDLTYGELAQRSLRYLRKFFPKAQYSSTSTPPSTINATNWHDFNGNGTLDTLPIYLEGHECLVFFLGGIPNNAGGGTISGMVGFGRNTANPFVGDVNAYPAGSVMAKLASSHDDPLFAFAPDRLGDEFGDGDRMPGYVDTLGIENPQRPPFYVYFSAYGNNGYDPNDVNLFDADDTLPIIKCNFGVQSTNVRESAAPNPYTGNATFSTRTPAYLNPDSFQIISSGRDRIFGAGGTYLATGTGSRLPLAGQGGTYVTVPASVPDDIRQREADNITNISKGTLE